MKNWGVCQGRFEKLDEFDCFDIGIPFIPIIDIDQEYLAAEF